MELNKNQIARYLFPVVALLCLFPFISSATALVLGVAMALFFGNPYVETTRVYTHRLLSLSVIGLGAGMDLLVVSRVGFQGIGYTIIGISVTFFLGTLIGRLLKVSRDTSTLITVGTAICGGSAIAAMAPTIRAKSQDVSVALGTVFILNALALVVFPWIGHLLDLTQIQFGLWSALAIHDTSSVVGSTLQFGPEALQIGTTVKLARALWIVPVTFLVGAFYFRGQKALDAGKAKKPWFILGFLIAAALVTWIPVLRPAGSFVEMAAKRGLVMTLFLIGANLTKETLKSVGLRPFVQGVTLWIVVASSTLGAVLLGWIK